MLVLDYGYVCAQLRMLDAVATVVASEIARLSPDSMSVSACVGE